MILRIIPPTFGSVITLNQVRLIYKNKQKYITYNYYFAVLLHLVVVVIFANLIGYYGCLKFFCPKCLSLCPTVFKKTRSLLYEYSSLQVLQSIVWTCNQELMLICRYLSAACGYCMSLYSNVSSRTINLWKMNR